MFWTFLSTKVKYSFYFFGNNRRNWWYNNFQKELLLGFWPLIAPLALLCMAASYWAGQRLPLTAWTGSPFRPFLSAWLPCCLSAHTHHDVSSLYLIILLKFPLQTAKRIRPLKKFRSQRINDASDELLRRHKSLPPSDKLLHQRHILISFPIHQVSFQLAGKSGIFWLYGRDNEIFFPDYPKKSLLQCDIM